MDKREIAAELRKASAGDADAQERTLSSLAVLLTELGATAGEPVQVSKDFTVRWEDSELAIQGLSDPGKHAVDALGKYLKGTGHKHTCPGVAGAGCAIGEYECKGGASDEDGPCAGKREVMCPHCWSSMRD